MGWQMWLAVGCVVLLMLLPLMGLYFRRRWLSGQGGLFDCAYQKRADLPGGGWVLGFARYRGATLQWFRAFSLGLKPKLVLERRTTLYEYQRPATGLEAVSLFDSSRVVVVRDRVTGATHSFAMDRDNVTALMSWLESAPPGSHYLPQSGPTPHERSL